MNLSNALVVAPATLSGPERKAVQMLVEEVEKRTQIRWPVEEAAPRAVGRPTIAIRSEAGAAGPAEGFRVHSGGDANTVFITGNDARGVLFGVGYLLRQLSLTRGSVSLRDDVDVSSAPRTPLRGHQLGYRPKTNSYDGWTLAHWEQYVRDLVVWGTNAIELIPPRSDDAADSPHFPQPPLETMIGMSQLCADYGVDVWVWQPALDKDYSDPATIAFALDEWAGVLGRLPRVDAVFVPGGDPGRTPPHLLFSLLEQQTQSLRRFHPNVQMWVSPQSFRRSWLDEFLELLHAEPDWLAGIVYGPEVHLSLADLRAAVPKRYPVRHYPDITHTTFCQFPVGGWDRAFALTLGREPICPRPRFFADVFHSYQPHTMGFVTYSEGCNDDVNKIVWSALGWDEGANVVEVLREYGRYFVGPDVADGFAQALLALENNWDGPLIANASVDVTLSQLQTLERNATPTMRLGWRFQQVLYRAYYDAYTRARLLYETALEAEAIGCLREAERRGSLVALAQAERILDRAVTHPIAGDLRARVFALAEALFQSIRMQLSVPLYQAIRPERGANLDAVDAPLNNRAWLTSRFAVVRESDDEPARLAQINALVNWTNPGPGGFYDNVGDPLAQPHRVANPGPNAPTGFVWAPPADSRLSWLTNDGGLLLDGPLTLRYHDLDPEGTYQVRVSYAPRRRALALRLEANGLEVHPFLNPDPPGVPMTFLLPREATQKGAPLTLTFSVPPDQHGDGYRGIVSEVWLERSTLTPSPATLPPIPPKLGGRTEEAKS